MRLEKVKVVKPERWQHISTLFKSALEREPAKRSAYLDEACADDDALRKEVESLLSSYERAESFIENPAVEMAAPLFTNAQGESVVGHVIGRYKIVSVLGAGGMGEVYLAHDTSLGRRVALKLLPAYYTRDPDRLRRFRQEARSASALNHPNIITIYEIGEAEGIHFIATEFIEGETLRQRMRRVGMKLGEALDVATQVASALSASHAAGVVHRDIKPENIMIRPDGFVKVLDFGIAKLTEAQSEGVAVDSEAATKPLAGTETGVIMGTISYMSPEQARGLQVDARTDIFSLGCVLYEMLAGRTPFEGPTKSDVLVSLLEREPTPFTQQSVAVPVELQQTISKALRKDPAERYQQIKDLALDLKSLKQELEIKGRPDRSAQPAPSAAATAAGRELVGVRAVPHILAASRRALILTAIAGLLVIAVAYALRFRGSSPSSEIKSLAVLPLKMVGGDAQDEYLSDGITDELITRLTKLKDVRVVSHSIAMRFKGSTKDAAEVGRELGVEVVLEGTVRKAGNRFRVSVHLVNTANGFELWADDGFENDLHDLLDAQRQLAESVAGKLRAQLTRQERSLIARSNTANVDAYELLLRGKQRYRDKELQLAREMFERATQIDPNFADAYAWLSLVLTEQYGAGLGDRKTLDDAIAKANKALEIDPNLIVAHRALITLYRNVSQTGEGLKQAKLARMIDPNDFDAITAAAYAYFEAGMTEKSIPLYEKALTADPSNEDVRYRLARSYQFAGKYQKGIDVLAPVLASNQSAEWTAMICYGGLKKYDKAVEMGEQMLKTDQKSPNLPGRLDYGSLLNEIGQTERAKQVWSEGASLGEAQVAMIENVRTRVWIGHLYAALGERDKAVAQMKRVLQLESDNAWVLYEMGEINAFLGNKHEAVEYFKQAIARGWLEVQYFYGYPDKFLGDDVEYRVVRAGLQKKVDELEAQYAQD